MVILACSLPVAAGRVVAQTLPEAPAIATVTPGTNTLAVPWSAPSENGGSTITAYDLRYIETDAADKADANWTLETDRRGLTSTSATRHGAGPGERTLPVHDPEIGT